MAVVYRATDTVLGRDVALKFIADEALGRREFREMFLREARSVAQLNHPNIVTIYDVGSLEGRTFIAMELVEGQTLEHHVVEQKKLSVVEALRATLQVLQALEYAHGRQIIHRDIKPSNMMRTASGDGEAHGLRPRQVLDHATKASVIAGTPAYMPPEQFAGQNVDHRADLYAVGVSLFEMLTGELPFPSPLRTGEAPSVRALVPQVPALVDDVLRRVLDIDPARRFQSARQFAAPLQKVLAVFDRAQEEREARHTHPAHAHAAAAPLGGAQTIAAQRPLQVKPPTQAAPRRRPRAPRQGPRAAAARAGERRGGEDLRRPQADDAHGPRRAAGAPPSTAPSAQRRPRRRRGAFREAPQRDARRVVGAAAGADGVPVEEGDDAHARAAPSAARGPAAQNAPSDTGSGARKATMMMGAAHAAGAVAALQLHPAARLIPALPPRSTNGPPTRRLSPARGPSEVIHTAAPTRRSSQAT